MLKKLVTFLLICVYSLSTLGLGVKQFYCCGKLKSTNLSFIQNTKEKCGMGNSTTGCCKTTFKSLKVKDSHLATDAISSPVKSFIDIHLIFASFETKTFANEPIDVANLGHAPPLHAGLPIYILHCVYRI